MDRSSATWFIYEWRLCNRGDFYDSLLHNIRTNYLHQTAITAKMFWKVCVLIEQPRNRNTKFVWKFHRIYIFNSLLLPSYSILTIIYSVLNLKCKHSRDYDVVYILYCFLSSYSVSTAWISGSCALLVLWSLPFMRSTTEQIFFLESQWAIRYMIHVLLCQWL